jgi:hypothetical protein
MGTFYRASIVSDGLVLCLDAASKTSYPGTGDSWGDLTGLSDGALINGPTFSGENHGGIVFDGSDDYVDCEDSSNLEFSSGESFTLSIWFKGADARGALLGKGYDTGSQDRPWYLLWCNNNSNGHVNLFVRSTSGSFRTVNSTKITDDEWHNVVGVSDASSATITTYTDSVAGTSVGSVSAQPYGTNGRPFVIGKHANDSINGTVSVVHVYNKALTASEILQNYNAIAWRYA